jgi:hypothetical protein
LPCCKRKYGTSHREQHTEKCRHCPDLLGIWNLVRVRFGRIYYPMKFLTSPFFIGDVRPWLKEWTPGFLAAMVSTIALFISNDFTTWLAYTYIVGVIVTYIILAKLVWRINKTTAKNRWWWFGFIIAIASAWPILIKRIIIDSKELHEKMDETDKLGREILFKEQRLEALQAAAALLQKQSNNVVIH